MKFKIALTALLSIIIALPIAAAGKENKMSKKDLRNKLTSEQYNVTQENGTERPFANAYWDNKEAGIYVDVVSGEPLFSSLDKYKSGSGWPSFTKPLDSNNVVEKEDGVLFMRRTEVRSSKGDSHLGHVFNDGPQPTGQRYCINSAALRFIPVAKLEQEGYGRFSQLFASQTNEKKAEKMIKKELATATFGAGCFWGVESILEDIEGVTDATSGYMGGKVDNPDYSVVSSGSSGHAEVVQIKYDPTVVTYEQLLDYFWRLHNPTTLNSQGPDYGTQYRSVIFYHSEEQLKVAEKSKEAFDNSGVFKSKAVTEIVPAATFFPAEDYHQNYYKKKSSPACHTLRDA